MKNTSLNTLEYNGIVTLSRYIGGKKIKIAQTKNSGRTPLFDFLYSCLTGDFDVARLNVPTKIMLLKSIENRDTKTVTYESRSGFIYLLTKPEKIYRESSQNSVKYSFMLSRDQLTALGTENSFDSIGLYADNETSTQNFSAVCTIELPTARMTASSVLVVDWELNIQNGTVQK